MIVVGRDADSERISWVFEGSNLAELVDAALANGCAEWVEVTDRPAPDARLVGGLILPPAPIDPDVTRAGVSVSRDQFLTAAASPPWLWITEAEAIAAASNGTLPAVFAAAISGWTDADRLAARVRFAGAQTVARLDPIVLPLASAEDLDAFFAFAGGL